MKNVSINLTVDQSKLTFPTDEQHFAFQKALGRMVMYAACYGGDREETVNVNLSVYIGQDITDLEILGTYKQNGHTFTMAGIARDNGTRYSYHS